MDVLHFGMDRALRAGFAAKAAGDAKSLFDSNLHRLLKKAHLLRCARPPRSNVLLAYASARRFLARLASEAFLISLESGFFNTLFMSLPNSF
jgi:hypothetical protein